MKKLTVAKCLTALGGLLFVCSSPAHAQRASSGGLGGGLGAVRFPTLLSYPARTYNVIEISGDSQGFVPSTFLPFEEAVGEGTATYAPPKTVVEAAADTRAKKSDRDKARIIVEQDARGNVVMVGKKS